jgi:folate-binding protein YgfZ
MAMGVDDAWQVIAVTGPDAATFLQARTTQDVLALEEGEGAWMALLDKSAHMVGYGSVHCKAHSNDATDTYWLVCPKTAETDVLSQLTRYRITEQVQFTPLSGYGYRISGNQAARHMQAMLGIQLLDVPPLGAVQLPMGTWADSVMFALPLVTDAPGWLWWVPHHVPQPSMPPEVAVPLTATDIALLQLESAQPRWGVDMDATTLLPETGLENVCVSYTKGCYLGQETVARVKTYGSVPKRLTGLRFSVAQPMQMPAPGSPVVLASGLTVGRFTQAATSPSLQQGVALAYLDKHHRTPGQVLELDVAGQPLEATVVSGPFVGQPLIAPEPVAQNADAQAPEASAQQTPQTTLTHWLTQFAQTPETDTAGLATIANALSTLVQQNPQFADAIEALGVLRSRQGKYAEAISLMENLLQVDPNRAMAHTNMSIYWLKLGNKDKAEEEKAKATVLAMKVKMAQAGHTAPTTQQIDALTQQRQEKVALFLNALKQYPEDALGNYGLGSVYAELNQPYDAIPCFKLALAGQPNHSVAYVALGKCYEATQQWVLAQQTYVTGVEVAAKRGDQMPLTEMQQRLVQLQAIVGG